MGDDELTGAEELGESSKGGGLKNIIIIAVIALVMGVGGFFAGKMLSGGGDEPQKMEQQTNGKNGQATQGENTAQNNGDQTAANTGTETGAENTGDTSTSGKKSQGILVLDTFTVNLNDPFGRRYIEIVLNLIIEPKGLVPKIKENELLMPKIRHEVFMTVQGKSYNELKSTSGKITLFEEIQMRVNEILKEYLDVEPVVEVLQTKFLIQ
jgi:flagellar FliL protein